MNETKQETINRVAWSACDIFRKVMEPTIYKDYILTMLFLKYISDIKNVCYAIVREIFVLDL